MATDAANALLVLSTPPRATVTAKTTTPVKSLKIAGLKRTSTHQHDITYETPEGKTCQIPLFADDKDDTFVLRRTKAARALYDPTRANVYCTWNGQLVNIPVKDARYYQFHDSLQQQRYMLNNVLQLVHSRHTCRGDKNACRSCEHRGFRAACQTPRFLYHMMPLPAYKSHPEMCDNALAEMEPVNIPNDAQPWIDHTPQNYVR